MIRYEGVTKVYSAEKEKKALDNVSFEIESGECVVFLGPSGCGKTTLLRSTNRLQSISSGSIKIKDVDINNIDPIKLRRSIGYVIQDVGLFPNKNILQNITAVPKLLKYKDNDIKKQVDMLLSMLNLDEELLHRYPIELSGGQQQRVGVARALAGDPDILLMDEPFGAIDPINRERIQNLFLNLQKKLKKSVAFVSHDIHEAIKMADKIAIFRDGALLQYDKPIKILTKPSDEFVASFIGSDRALKILGLISCDEVYESAEGITVPYDITQEMASKIFEEQKQNYLIVLKDAKAVGYILKEDIGYSSKKIADKLKNIATTIERKQPLREALASMLMNDVSDLCVVGENGDFEGVISYMKIQEKIYSLYQKSGDLNSDLVYSSK